MIGTPTQQRREAKVASIVETAWALAREHGIAGVSLHGLARELGIRQPSLYAYFGSKHELYDAMFADGNRQLLERLDAVRYPRDPRAAVKRFFRTFVSFAVEDNARCALLFERPIPGFVPSASSYALAEEVWRRVVVLLNAAGMTDPDEIDCITAMAAGLIAAHMANDPGGTRYIRHLDRMIDMHLDNATRSTNR